MNRQSTNELPNLSPVHESSPPNNPIPTPKQTTTLPPKTESGEFFVNPNPPTAEKPVHENILRKISNRWVIGTLLLILTGIVGFTLHEIVFNKITALTLVPANTEYYLTLSIKEHPQAKKAEELVEKLPGGKKILESLSNYSTELLGPQDPFEDIFRLSKDEIFLAKLYPESDQKEINFAGINDLLNIVELNRPRDARNELKKLTEDIDLYDTSEQNHNGSAIYNIKLKKESGSTSERFDIGPLPSRVTLPLSKGIFAAPVKNFILAGENISDVKRSLDLSKIKSIFGFNNSKLKSLQDDKSHKKLSKYFPKETLVKFYQNQPLSPYGDYLPLQSLGQSFISPQGVISNPEGRAETFTRVPQGLTITAEDNGMSMTSYQLDIKNPDGPLNNPFKFEDSLATRLPEKFSGISPAFYGEAKNYYQVYKDQIEQIKDVAENSDNRTQREQFKKMLEFIEESKKQVRNAIGIDYEKDLLAYLDSHVATIFNAGNAKKSPEFILVAEVKDASVVEKSLKKLKIPDYVKESKLRTENRVRETDLRNIALGVSAYLTANQKVPKKLADLVPSYIIILPKDPVTEKSYRYTPSSDLKSAQVEVNLNDGRTAYWSSTTGAIRYNGTAKKTIVPPLIPKKSTYKKISLYSLSLYSYQKTTLKMYFAASDGRLVILFGTNSQSLKDIFDFKPNTGKSLASGEIWQSQFAGKGDIGGFTYVEPIQFWGMVDYTKNLYPEYNAYVTSDIEVALKGYLKSLRSIGTTVSKEDDVHTTKSFIEIIELPAEEKKRVEDAVQRLLDKDRNNGFNSVLGIETSKSTLDLWKERIKRLFIPLTIR